MFNFKQTYPRPNEYTKGKNTIEFVLLHHTATGGRSMEGVIDGCMERKDEASFHFAVDTNGDAYKFGEPTDILWHAGESERGDLDGMNKYSIGIEIIGPLNDGGFTRKQFITVCSLVQHLRKIYGIPLENVLKHSDVTWAKSKQKILWDGVTPPRKRDLSPKFWQDRSFANFEQFRRECL